MGTGVRKGDSTVEDDGASSQQYVEGLNGETARTRLRMAGLPELVHREPSMRGLGPYSDNRRRRSLAP